MLHKKHAPIVSISLIKADYTQAELNLGISVGIQVTGTLPKGEYAVALCPAEGTLSTATSIPVTIEKSIQNHTFTVALGPDNPGWESIPWSEVGGNDQNQWTIHFAQQANAGLQSLADTSLTVTQNRPVIVSLVYEIGSLQVSWDPQDYSDFIVTLTCKGKSVQNLPVTGSSAVFEKILDPQDTYLVMVTAVVDGTPGLASIQRMAIVSAPVYDQLKYSLLGGTGILDASWTAITGAGAYITSIQASDGSLKTNVPSVSPASQLVKNLNPLLNYTVLSTAMSADGVVIGPAGTAISAIVAQPVVSHLGYDLEDLEGTVSMEWGTVNLAAKYTVTIEAANGSYDESFPSNSTSVVISTTLEPTEIYMITLFGSSSDGVVTGPESDPLSPLLVPPVISQLMYTLPTDGGQLLTKWDEVTDATEYVTTIQALNGSYLKNLISTEPTSTLLQTLDPSLAYQVTVVPMAQSGIITGPASQVLNAIVEQPVFSLVNYSFNTGSALLQMQWQEVLNAETYITTVNATDGSYHANIPSDVPESSLSKTLSVQTVYNIVVSSMSTDGVVTGPVSASIQPITEAPALDMVEYDLVAGSGGLTSSWSEITMAQGYITTVKATDGSFLKNIVSEEPDSTLTAQLNSSLTYLVEVIAMADNGIVTGPESNQVTVLQTTPAEADVTYDGAALYGTWTADTSPQCSGYIAELLKDGSVMESNNTSLTDYNFPGALEDGCIYTMQVRSTGANAMGPWCNPAFAPYATQIIYEYDQLGRLLTADANETYKYVYTFSSEGNIETASAVAGVNDTFQQN